MAYGTGLGALERIRDAVDVFTRCLQRPTAFLEQASSYGGLSVLELDITGGGEA